MTTAARFTHTVLYLLSFGFFALLSGEGRADLYKVDRGPHAIQVTIGAWHDQERSNRQLLWKLMLPDGLTAPVPLVIWSHGAGGTRDGHDMLGLHLASWGYAVLSLQHQGSDLTAMRTDRGTVVAQQNDPKLGADRFRDIAFAVAQLRSINGIDVSRIGMSGHSFGAITSMVAAGQRVPGFGDTLSVPAFKAAFAMSPSPPRQLFSAQDNFDKMLMPIFHLTGTLDEAPDFQPVDRQLPFKMIRNVDQYLMVLKAANHLTFTGLPRPYVFGKDWSYPSLARHHDILKSVAVAFWDSELKGDKRATRWLRDGEAANELGQEGSLQFKAKN